MVLDINLFRSSETLEIVRKSHYGRFGSMDDIDDIISHDEKVRKLNYEKNNYAKLENMIKKTMGNRYKSKKQDKVEVLIDNVILPDAIKQMIPNIDQNILDALTVQELIKISQYCREKRDSFTNQANEHEEMRTLLLKKIGNILHESVPIGKDDESNVLVRVETVKNNTTERPHYELIKMIDGVDTEAGSKIAGNRGYFLKGSVVYLAQALQQLALAILDEKDFIAIQTPYFMNEDIMANVAQLSQFDEELYKISQNDGDENTSTIKYLIATSEQPLTALHMEKRFIEKQLPIKYAGISTCFRKEAGRQGKDMSGIFRVHQFEKIEQFIICSSENNESWLHLESMLNNVTEFLDVLKLPYRIVNIASGELNLAAAKKYDFEIFLPGSNSYREIVSCSNCTDYHSRNLGIKYVPKDNTDAKHVHMLNSTMCAVTRMICAILENYQTEDGIKVPDALQKYMPNRYKKFIPFIKTI